MKKLILFDIDGTLISFPEVKKEVEHWQERVTTSIKAAYGVDVLPPQPGQFNGFVDRNMYWFLTRDAGLSKTDFDRKFQIAAQFFFEKTKEHYEEGKINWKAIPEAVSVVKKIKTKSDHALGLITGNVEANAWYKIETTGLKEFFEFGVFADEVEDRNALALLALAKSAEFFGITFPSKDVIVIGDTKHDIRSGKSIGAFTIAVTTGVTDTIDILRDEQPDLLVDSLMDDQVINLLGL